MNLNDFKSLSAKRLFLNPQQLVVLGQALTSARRPSLQVTGAKSDGEICDEGVLRLAGSVRHEDAPPEGQKRSSVQ